MLPHVVLPDALLILLGLAVLVFAISILLLLAGMESMRRRGRRPRAGAWPPESRKSPDGGQPPEREAA